MKPSYMITILVACLAAAHAAVAADTVRKNDNKTVIGQIMATSRDALTVMRASGKMDVPVDQIKVIVYGGEPSVLGDARASAGRRRYADALKSLDAIDASRITRKEILSEIEYLKAFAAAQLALSGQGEITEAGGQMWKFITSHADSYRWFEANRLAGDLLMANRQYAAAINYYSALAKAASLRYRLQAAVGIGQANLAAGKPDEAMTSFQQAIDMATAEANEKDVDAMAEHKLAQIGKARCLAAKKQWEEAAKMAREVIDKADPENAVVCARAYNALGAALRQGGKTEDALLAFLHVDILYATSPEDHAEALANLAALWQQLHRTDRAIQAQETLQQRYKNSRWASR